MKTPLTPCPNDTDGDGNCGRKYCPFCGPTAYDVTPEQRTFRPISRQEFAVEITRDDGSTFLALDGGGMRTFTGTYTAASRYRAQMELYGFKARVMAIVHNVMEEVVTSLHES